MIHKSHASLRPGRESIRCKCLLGWSFGEPTRRERKGAKRSDACGFMGAKRSDWERSCRVGGSERERQGSERERQGSDKGATRSDHGRLEAVIAPCRSRTTRAKTGHRQQRDPCGPKGNSPSQSRTVNRA